MAAIFWIWFLGVIVSAGLFSKRAFGHYQAAGLWMSHGQYWKGWPWATASGFNAMMWPIVLLLWLAADQPPPPTLYGANAAHELGLSQNDGFKTKVEIRPRWQLLQLALGSRRSSWNRSPDE